MFGGIFGQISKTKINKKKLILLAKHTERRGKNSSGLLFFNDNHYAIAKSEASIMRLLKEIDYNDTRVIFGFAGGIITKQDETQPLIRDKICIFNSGLIINNHQFYKGVTFQNGNIADAESMLITVSSLLKKGENISELPEKILNAYKGNIACVLLLIEYGKAVIFTNYGSLYIGYSNDDVYISSERFPLSKIRCEHIKQVRNGAHSFEIPKSDKEIKIYDLKHESNKRVYSINMVKGEDQLLEYRKPQLKRCVKCILPETMPFITFDEMGVCNYCNSYKVAIKGNSIENLMKIVDRYRKPGDEPDCIVPFSGGRDSSYALIMLVKELGLKPILFTYDWGMATDLAKKNISRICSLLGVEHILVSADIEKKRRNVALNLAAWLKYPHLGLVSLLTAGDKHFFKYIEVIKKQTGIDLNIWGTNPLEVTHFKSGFLGIPPDLKQNSVYMRGLKNQLYYHYKRFLAMANNWSYFNRSLWDTLSGEYYRSISKKKDYYHFYDYWTWDENVINSVLINEYGWETADDTNATWRIDDGTAAFYNYIYYTVAGFTENDTFRSNQIREGQLTRERALALVEEENMPRYKSIKWYLTILGFDFGAVIKVINSIPKLYKY